MTKTFAAASVLALSIATGASAADLPRKTVAPVIAVPAFTWTGFYVGVNAGYGFGEAKSTGFAVPPLAGNWNAPFAATLPGQLDGKIKLDGFVGGAHVGYNYQWNQIVLGIEADAMYHGQKGTRDAFNLFFPGASLPFAAEAKMEWSASIRGRLGFAIDRLLIYGTGGAAFTTLKYNSSFRFFPFIDGGFPGSGHFLSLSESKTGYVVGGGLEYAVTNNLTVRAEYLYYDFGRITGETRNNAFALPINQRTSQTAKFTNNVIRAGISYKF